MSPEIADLLHRAAVPAMTIDPYAVVAGGRRRHRRRMVATVAAWSAVVAAITALAVGLGHDHGASMLPAGPPSSTTSAPPDRLSAAAAHYGPPFRLDLPANVKVRAPLIGLVWVSPIDTDGSGARFQRLFNGDWDTPELALGPGMDGVFWQGTGSDHDHLYVVTSSRLIDPQPTWPTPLTGNVSWRKADVTLGTRGTYATVLVLSGRAAAAVNDVSTLSWVGPAGHRLTAWLATSLPTAPPTLALGFQEVPTEGLDAAGNVTAAFLFVDPSAAAGSLTVAILPPGVLEPVTLTLGAARAAYFQLWGDKSATSAAFPFVFGLVRGDTNNLTPQFDQPGRSGQGYQVNSVPIDTTDVRLVIITLTGISAPSQLTEVTWTSGGTNHSAPVVVAPGR